MHQALAFAACALWAGTGLLLPVGVVTSGISMPSLDQILLVAGSILLASAFSQVRFAFKHAENRLEISPDTAFIVVAAVLLAPAQAALVALIASYWATRRYSGWKFVFFSANSALAAGAASALCHAVVGSDPSGKLVLPAALIAAAVRVVISFAGFAVFEEARAPRSGFGLLRNTPIVAIFMLDVGLPVAAICMAGPFLDTPLAAFGVLIAAEGFTFVVLRMLYDDHMHRQQNDYLRDTFSRYMPLPVANKLLATNEQVDLGGEEREITVMFCDVREFTAWAELHQPEDVIGELNGLLGELSQAVLNTRGTLDKFTGDGLMAFWGAPQAQPDHAVRAVNAVAQMSRCIRRVNKAREDAGKPPFAIGIGLNSGPAMVGNVGHVDRLNYTAIGDTVNLAARLESVTKELDCSLLMSEATFLALPLKLQRQCARMESIEVKGRRDRVRLYTFLPFSKGRTARKNSAA